jgi:hypothetical protein
MATAYTPILKLALPVTGELAGQWGDVVNNNITSMVEQAVAGLATINTWTANSHTLTTANGTTSESRCAMLVLDDDGAGNPSAAATVICPTETKAYIVRNISGQTVTVKTSAGTGVAVPNNQSALVFCDGTNVVTGSFNGDVVGPATATNTAIAIFDGTTGKLIKNTGVTIDGSNNVSGVVQLNATTLDATNLEVTNLKAKDGTAAGSIADSTGVVTLGSSVLTTTAISGGTINNTSVGATTRSTGAFTTLTSNNATTFTAGTASTSTTTGTAVITGGLGVSGRVNAANFDGIVGANTATAGTFTNLTSTGNTTLGDAAADTVTINGTPTINAPTVITTNSTSDALRITQVGSGNALLVEDSANPDATPFVVDNDGRVAIGATTFTPVEGSFSNVRLQISSGDPFSAIRYGISNNPVILWLGKNRSNDGSTQTIVNNADVLGRINFSGSDGSTLVRAASIEASVDGTPGTNDMPGRLVLSTTASGASSPTERMRIDNAGRFGFGTTTLTSGFISVRPNQTDSNLFYVRPTIQSGITDAILFNSNPLIAAGAALTGITHYFASPSTFTGTATNQYGFSVSSGLSNATNNYGFYSNIASGTGRWNFYANGTADNYFAGNVGIGTSSPTNALQLVGTAKASSQLYVGSNSDDNYSGGIQNLSNTSRSISIQADPTNAGASTILTFGVDGSERMRIDSSGNVGIGTTTTSNGRLNVVAGTGTTGNSLFLSNSDGTYNPFVQIQHNGINGVKFLNSSSFGGTAGNLTIEPASNLIFSPGQTERARIDSSGNLLVGKTASVFGKFEVQSDATWIQYNTNTKTSDINGIRVQYTAATPNNTTNYFLFCEDSTAARFYVLSNGGLANYSGNNVNLSDRREKTNFNPAGEYLSKICAIPVQTFNYIDQNNDEDPGLTLGVVAQDVQAVAPEFVMESNWGTKEEPKMRLSIYQTDLQYALMKCIQEQQALIQDLTTRLTTLEGN